MRLLVRRLVITMNRAFLLVFLLQCAPFAFAQFNPTLTWQRGYGGSKNDIAEQLIRTNDGGFLMAGWSSSIDGDNSRPNGHPSYPDGWIVKLDSSFNVEWDASVGSWNFPHGVTAIAESASGGYLLSYLTRLSILISAAHSSRRNSCCRS